jgi:hypothetical protein
MASGGAAVFNCTTYVCSPRSSDATAAFAASSTIRGTVPLGVRLVPACTFPILRQFQNLGLSNLPWGGLSPRLRLYHLEVASESRTCYITEAFLLGSSHLPYLWFLTYHPHCGASIPRTSRIYSQLIVGIIMRADKVGPVAEMVNIRLSTVPPHPLEQLGAGEIHAARSIIRRLRPYYASIVYTTITLEEPPKATLIPFLEAEHNGKLDPRTERPPRLARVLYHVVSHDQSSELCDSIVDVLTGDELQYEVVDKRYHSPLNW